MERRTYPDGVPSWIDTDQADVEAAKHFYGGLFGWSFTDMLPAGTPVRYVIATLDGQDVAALSGPADPTRHAVPGEGGAAPGEGGAVPARTRAVWNTYVAVGDAEATANRLTAAGGRLLQPPADAGDAGRWAVCADPAGVEFRLWQAGQRPGAQAVNVPGSWNFSDLHAADPGQSAAFYTEVFGWAFDDLGFATMIRRPGYGDHLEATTDPDIRVRQAGAPAGFEDAIGWLAPAGAGETPHWHVTFSVADRDQAATEAERLGGAVLARDDNEWTRTALVRDPQGAQVTLSQYDPHPAA
jgi:hypothetical protein